MIRCGVCRRPLREIERGGDGEWFIDGLGTAAAGDAGRWLPIHDVHPADRRTRRSALARFSGGALDDVTVADGGHQFDRVTFECRGRRHTLVRPLRYDTLARLAEDALQRPRPEILV